MLQKQYNVVVCRDMESIIDLVVHKFQKERVGKIGCLCDAATRNMWYVVVIY